MRSSLSSLLISQWLIIRRWYSVAALSATSLVVVMLCSVDRHWIGTLNHSKSLDIRPRLHLNLDQLLIALSRADIVVCNILVTVRHPRCWLWL